MPGTSNFGIPNNLENVLGNLISQRANRLNQNIGATRLSAGTPRGGGRGETGLEDLLNQLFAVQDRRLAIGNQFANLRGLFQGIGGFGGGRS